MVTNLLQSIQKQAEKERESRALDYALQKMRNLLNQYTLTDLRKPTDNDSIIRFISYIEDQAEKEKTLSIYNLSDQALYQINSLISGALLSTKRQSHRVMYERNQSKQQADQIDSYLSVDIDEKSLAKAYKKIKTQEQEIIEIQAEIEAEQKRRVTLHGDALRANLEYKRFVEGLLAKLELNDDGDRLLKYAQQANVILQEYRIRLQRQKIGVLAATMTACYKKLANKKNLIERIEMNDTTLDFFYLDYNGELIPNGSLSAGERQLMVISLLWALAICSKKELPVIIDTPLSRMDSNHRVSLITTYFPQASKQTIILSTDSEIDQHYYEIMKDNVGDEFTLVYDDVKKCSTIERGYFVGDANDNQAD